MNLNINDEQLQAIVAKTILDNMTAEKRDELFMKAIEYMLTPPKDSYGNSRGRSPIQAVFDQQVEHAARIIRAAYKQIGIPGIPFDSFL